MLPSHKYYRLVLAKDECYIFHPYSLNLNKTGLVLWETKLMYALAFTHMQIQTTINIFTTLRFVYSFNLLVTVRREEGNMWCLGRNS